MLVKVPQRTGQGSLTNSGPDPNVMGLRNSHLAKHGCCKGYSQINASLIQIPSTQLRKWLSFKIASSHFCCTNKRQMKHHLLSQPSLTLFPVLHLCLHGTSAQHHLISHPFCKIPAFQWHRLIPFSTPLTDPDIQKAFNNACGIESSVQ